MFRPAAQTLFRSSSSALPRRAIQLRAARRHVSTAPPHEKSRSWKSSALRWGFAGAGLYWYNSSTVFAEEPAYPAARIPITENENENLPTIDDLAAARKARMAAAQEAAAQEAATLSSSPTAALTPATSPGELEEEAEEQGAFNPETGEINWDCPCLGGMAHGPCGEEFRAAFSCFVFSKEEPKGMDCVDKFRGMQDCFRKHPDIYGEELADDGEDADLEVEGAVAQEGQLGQPGPAEQPAPVHTSTPATDVPVSAPKTAATLSDAPSDAPHTTAKERLKNSDAVTEADELVPREWHDGREDKKKSSG